MTTETNYYGKDIAEKFHLDPFDVYVKTRQQAIAQLRQLPVSAFNTVLDIGAGTGNTLVDVQQHFKTNNLWGMDISAQMLAQAKQRLPDLNSIVGTIEQLPNYLDDASCDLIVSHFILAYVDIDLLFQQAHRLLKPGAYYAIASTTAASFAKMFDKVLQNEKSLLNRFTVRANRNNIDAGRNSVPDTMQALCDYVTAQGFKVVHANTHTHQLHFNNFNELWAYAYDAGWFINYLIERKISKRKGRLVFELARLLKMIEVPFDDVSEVAVLTLQKT